MACECMSAYMGKVVPAGRLIFALSIAFRKAPAQLLNSLPDLPLM